MPRISPRLACLLIVPASFSLERAAAACGGTFCDITTGTQTHAVNQTGENILFVMDGTSVEAHIQIQYAGDAATFAWVIPMPTVPESSVGSQPLFTNLLAGSAPTYGYSTTTQSCGGSKSGGSKGGSSSSGGGKSSGSGSSTGSGGTKVVYEKTVGAYDVTILKGGTAQEVSDWLSTNGYQATAGTPQLLQDYVTKNYVFAAVKLTNQTGIDEIHPLVLKYPGTMPCVPLILTAEAATDNMGVRAFFLGSDRVYSENYATVTLNELKVNWLSDAANYDAAVAAAVDEAPGGQAFVTEYAGASSVISTAGIYSASWDAMPFEDMKARYVVHELERQGLARCNASKCIWNHPLLLGLLHEYLPPPAGYTDDQWYPGLEGEAALIDHTAWKAPQFASDFDTRIVQPGLHAVTVLGAESYLTRLFTHISPPEMTVDPTFNARPDLSNQLVSNRHVGNRLTTCIGQSAMILPSGKEVALAGDTWPGFDMMPWSSTIDSVPSTGPVVNLVDNTDSINCQLVQWDMSQSWSPSGVRCASSTSTSTTTTGSGSGTTSSPSSGPGSGPGGGGAGGGAEAAAAQVASSAASTTISASSAENVSAAQAGTATTGHGGGSGTGRGAGGSSHGGAKPSLQGGGGQGGDQETEGPGGCSFPSGGEGNPLALAAAIGASAIAGRRRRRSKKR